MSVTTVIFKENQCTMTNKDGTIEFITVPNGSISSKLAVPQDLQLFNKTLTPLPCRHFPHKIPVIEHLNKTL